MRLSWLAAASLADLLVLGPRLVAAADPLWIPPSTQWLGIDGNWSTFSFLVGSPSQSVDLLASTSLSEIWVVENTGCSNLSLCYNARGGVFDYRASTTWGTIGTYQLQLPWLAEGGNGNYGEETIAVTSTSGGSSATVAVNGALVAGINTTDFYQGFIGIGGTAGNFSDNIYNPYISQLSSVDGIIPSHSYGFTAGAYYAGQLGVPASLTLGGYDSMRFQESAAVNFNLDPSVRIPTVTVRSISVSSTSGSPRVLSNMTDIPNAAIVDSSTPLLWLPTAVCLEFESALNLTWNDTLGVYLYPNVATYTKFLKSSPFSMTFSLSSYDDANPNKGLDASGIVNITISSAAFAQYLTYPFESIIQQDQYQVPYFPLRRSPDNATTIIGRVFMQEAYMVMMYDQGLFSVNQALFPQNPMSNYSLVAIERNSDSPYPAYVPPKTGTSAGVYAGIAIGALAALIGLAVAFWCCTRRSRRDAKKTASDAEEEATDFESVTEAEEPISPVKRIFSKITRRKRSKKPTKVHEVAGNDAQPVEVGAEAHNQRYEMPVPPPPVELPDSSYDIGDDVTELGTEGSEGLSAYEIARRKLDRQLMGPVPGYSPPATGTTIAADEKTEQDVSPVAHVHAPEDHLPISPESGNNSNSLPNTLPSPVSPHTDWSHRNFNMPSPSAVVPPLPSPRSPMATSDPSTTYSAHSPRSFEPSSLSRSNSLNSSQPSPRSPVGTLPAPVTGLQRSPIDPSRVVCLGPLPENIRLPTHHPSIPRLITPDGPSGGQASSSSPASRGEQAQRTNQSDTLGSNFTVDEETRVRDEMTRRQQGRSASPRDQSPPSPSSPDSPVSPASGHSNERIDAGCELVHVPQLADRRFSFEEGGDG